MFNLSTMLYLLPQDTDADGLLAPSHRTANKEAQLESVFQHTVACKHSDKQRRAMELCAPGHWVV